MATMTLSYRGGPFFKLAKMQLVLPSVLSAKQVVSVNKNNKICVLTDQKAIFLQILVKKLGFLR